MQMVSHMVSYEQQLRQEVLLNIERLQAGHLSDADDQEDEVTWVPLVSVLPMLRHAIAGIP